MKSEMSLRDDHLTPAGTSVTHRFDLGFDGFGDFNRVLTGLAAYLERNARLAVQGCNVRSSSAPSSTRATSPSSVGRASWRNETTMLIEVVERDLTSPLVLTLNSARSPDEFHIAAGHVGILAAQCRDDVVGGHVQRAHPVGVEPDADLPLAPAQDRHGADARDALEAFLDLSCRRMGQVARRHVARQHHREDRFGVRVDLLDDRLIGVLRQVAQREVDLVAHVLRLDVGIFAQAEFDDDLREALGTLRGQRLDAGDRVDLGFDVSVMSVSIASGLAPSSTVITLT